MENDIRYIWQHRPVDAPGHVGQDVCSILAAFLSARTAMGFGRILRSKIFAHVERFSLHEFDQDQHALPDHPEHERRHPDPDGRR